jgi:hypothetical protein
VVGGDIAAKIGLDVLAAGAKADEGHSYGELGPYSAGLLVIDAVVAL